MSIAPLRIYTQPNFEGTEYSFTDADRGQIIPIIGKEISSDYSVKIAEGYVYKTYNINSNIWLSGDIANLSLTAQDEVYLSIFFIFQKVAAQIGDIYIFTHQVNDYQNFTPFDPTWTSPVSITTQPFYVVEIKNTQTNSISLTTSFTNSTVQSSFGFSDPAEYEFRLVGGINESLPVIPIARVYNQVSYGGTEFKFMEINVDTLYAFSDYSINGNFSVLLEPGYGLEVANPSTNRRLRYFNPNLNISNKSSIILNELGTHFYIRKIAASFANTLNSMFNSFMINGETNFSRAKIFLGYHISGFPSGNEIVYVREGYSLIVDNTSYSAGTYTLNVASSVMSVGMVIPYWKRVQLNLYDAATDSFHFQLNQKNDSTKFDLPTNLTFVDANNSRSISDVLDYLERVVSVETDINNLTIRTTSIEFDINNLGGRASVNEADIDSIETRASVNEADLDALDSRSDSNASRLLVDDSEFSALEAYIDALETRASVVEADIELLETRASVNEADLVALDSRSDSNASRLLVDDSELSALEAYVDALESRFSVVEVNIDSLESRASVNEADLVVLKNRADSNASRLIVNDSELSALEAYVDSLEGRMSTTEVDIVDLENSFTVYEADVVDIKGTLYAISDGNIESMLSSLQEIKDSFESNINMAEDMAELNTRLTELASVMQELTE